MAADIHRRSIQPAIGGRCTLALHPGALGALSAGRGLVLVSGMNGKTTTSHMLGDRIGGGGTRGAQPIRFQYG